nr:unnamed protein product [Spirometra erinaceieuropaei]
MELTHHLIESFGTAEFLHDSPQSFATPRIKVFRQINEGSAVGAEKRSSIFGWRTVDDLDRREEVLPFAAVRVSLDLLGLLDRPGVLNLAQPLLHRVVGTAEGCFVVVGVAVGVDFVWAFPPGEQDAYGGVAVSKPVLVLAACATMDSRNRLLDCVPQLIPSGFHGDGYVSGGGSSDWKVG